MTNENYYRFTDAHPTGGNASVTISESQIIEHMRQFIDNKKFTDIQCIMRFMENRKATPIATKDTCDKGDDCLAGTDKCEKEDCKDTVKTDTCDKGSKCCKKVMSGSAPDKQVEREL